VLHVGGAVSDSTAHLILYAHDIDLEAVTAAVGCAPTEAHRRGEVVGKRRPARTGLWSLETPEELSFPEKLEYLIRSTSSDHASWDALAAGHDIQLRCAIFLRAWTEGFELPAVLLAEIGRRHWSFGLSMYSAEGEEIVEAFFRDAPNEDSH
jgi:hypothetical protein